MPGIIRVEWWRDPKGFDVRTQFGPGNELATDKESRDIWADFDELEGDHRAGIRKGVERWLVPRTPCPMPKRDRGSYVLEGTNNGLFLELANTPGNVEGALAFVNKWGVPCPDSGSGEMAVRSFLRLADMMRKAVHLAKLDPAAAIERLGRTDKWKPGVELTLRIGRLPGDLKPRIFLEAGDLYDFCKAEFLQLLEGGTEIRDCGNCGTLFTIGRVGNQPIYCSDRCRVAAHRKSKRAREKRQKR